MKNVIINEEELSCEQAHRKLWNWLSDNPNTDKEDFFKEFDIYGDDVPYNECFACESCYGFGDTECSECPIQWTEKEQISDLTCYCSKDGSPYEKWEDAKDLEERKTLAREIANKEWNSKESE